MNDITHVRYESLKDAVWTLLETYRPSHKEDYEAIYDLAKWADLDTNEIRLEEMPTESLKELQVKGYNVFREIRRRCEGAVAEYRDSIVRLETYLINY